MFKYTLRSQFHIQWKPHSQISLSVHSLHESSHEMSAQYMQCMQTYHAIFIKVTMLETICHENRLKQLVHFKPFFKISRMFYLCFYCIKIHLYLFSREHMTLHVAIFNLYGIVGLILRTENSVCQIRIFSLLQ